MNIKKTISNSFTIAIVLLLSIIVFVFVLDIRAAYKAPELYEQVHRKSISQYALESCLMIAYFTIGLALCGFKLFDKKQYKLWRMAFYLFIASTALIAVARYIHWASTGFDH